MNEDEIRGGVRYYKGKVEKGVGDIADSPEWQADGIVDQVAGAAQHLYGRAREKVQDVVEETPGILADAGDKARDVARQSQAVAVRQVEDNPWVIVVAAAVMGYGLSWLVHGRRD